MPHKKNPIICERICGLSRVLRSNMIAAMENISLWHERDISHSSAERIIIPDSFILLDYMLEKTIFVIEGLNVIESNMKRNLMKYGGIVFSQRILLELIKKGMSREDAYILVQKAALEAWNNEGSFKENLLKEEKILSFIDRGSMEKLFEVEYHLKYIDEIIDRLKYIK
jgi:adenylosuccinate lyase